MRGTDDLRWLDRLHTTSSTRHDIDERVDRLFIDRTLEARKQVIKRQQQTRTKPRKKVSWSKIILLLLSVALVFGLLLNTLPVFYGEGDFDIAISIEPTDPIEGDLIYLNATIPASYNITHVRANISGRETINLILLNPIENITSVNMTDNRTTDQLWQGTWLCTNFSAGDHLIALSAMDDNQTLYTTSCRWTIASNVSDNESEEPPETNTTTNETTQPKPGKDNESNEPEVKEPLTILLSTDNESYFVHETVELHGVVRYNGSYINTSVNLSIVSPNQTVSEKLNTSDGLFMYTFVPPSAGTYAVNASVFFGNDYAYDEHDVVVRTPSNASENESEVPEEEPKEDNESRVAVDFISWDSDNKSSGKFGRVIIDYDKAWKYVLKKAEWNLQAFVNGSWQDAKGLKVKYTKTADHLRKFSLDFTASADASSDYRLILTVDIPVTDYRFDESAHKFYLNYDSSSGPWTLVYDYSDIAGLPGLVFGHGLGGARFWFSVELHDVSFGTDISLDPTYGVISNAVVDSFEWQTTEGRTYSTDTVVKLGDGPYYLIISSAGSGTQYWGYLYTIKVWDNNGTIQNSVVDEYMFNSRAGAAAMYYASLQHISGDIYAACISNFTASRVEIKTFRAWSTNGTIQKSPVDEVFLQNYRFFPSLLRIGASNFYAVLGCGAAGNNISWIHTVSILPDGDISSWIDYQLIDSNYTGGGSMEYVSGDTIAIVLGGPVGEYSTCRIYTYNITKGVIADTYTDICNITTNSGTILYPKIKNVHDNVFAIAYVGPTVHGFVSTINISDTGMIAESFTDTLEFETGYCQEPYLFEIGEESDDVYFGISYQGAAYNGFTKTFSITKTGNISAVIDSLEFDTADSKHTATTVHVSDNYWLTVYEGTGNDGWSCTYTIETPPTSWWDNDWIYSKKITINHTLVDADLVDFPVLISMTDTDLRDNAQSTGYDIAFVNSGNTSKYHHEIEHYDSATGELIAWVKIPYLSSTVDTELWMYYGNDICDDQQNIAGTWDSDYVMVHHLSDLTTSNVLETINNGAWVKNSANNPLEEDGLIYKCQNFSTDRAGSPTSGGPVSVLVNGSTQVTISTWIKPYSLVSGTSPDNRIVAAMMFIRGGLNYNSFTLSLQESGKIKAGARSIWSDSLQTATTSNPEVSTNDWYYVTAVYDFENDDIYIYCDGNEVLNQSVAFDSDTYTKNTTDAPAEKDYIGGGNNAPVYPYQGKADEVRISKVGRSPEWIQTEYTNQIDPFSFYTIGDERTCILHTFVDQIFPYYRHQSSLTINATGNETLDNVTLYYRYTSDNITGSNPGEVINFGRDSYPGGGDDRLISSYAYGAGYAALESGYVHNITWYLNKTAGTTNFKVAIYDSSLNLLGQGARSNVGSGDWYTTELDSPAYVEEGRTYWLVGRAETASTNCYHGSLWEQPCFYRTVAYNTFPENPLVIDGYPTGRSYYVYATIVGDNTSQSFVPWSNPSNPDTNGADGWSWDFDFPDGGGYYEFYSVSSKNDTVESTPTSADAICSYDTQAPSSSVAAISPYVNTTGSVELTATASDALSGVNDVTLWYRWSEDNVTWSPSSALSPFGVISDAAVDSWEFDQQEGRVHNPTALLKLDDSEYYVTSAFGDTGSDSDGFLRVLKVWNNNGTIQRSLVDKWEYDGSDGGEAGLCHISGDVYAVIYRDANEGKVITTTIWSSNGTLKKDIIDTFNLTYKSGDVALLHVTGNVYVAAYQEYGGGYDRQLETIEIFPNGSITDIKLDLVEFDSTPSVVFTSIHEVMVDSDTILVTYQEYNSYDLWLATYNISSSGDIANTYTDRWEYDTGPTTAAYPFIYRIAGNVFAIAYGDGDDDGWVKTITISDVGKITKSWIDTLEYKPDDDVGMMTIFTVAGALDHEQGVYGITYQYMGYSGGQVCTVNISSDGAIGDSIIDALGFETSGLILYAPCVHVAGNYYLILYTHYTSFDGWAATVEITTDNGWSVWDDASNPDASSPWNWTFTFPNGTGYYEFYSIATDNANNVETAPASADAICRFYQNTTITVTPDYWHMGSVNISDTNETSEFYFNLTNDGNVVLDITINATNATNGTGVKKWTLGSPPAHDTFSLWYKKDGDPSWTNITTSYTAFASSLGVGLWQTFDLKLLMATTSSTTDSLGLTVTFKSVAT